MDSNAHSMAERLRKARGHLDGAIRLAEADAACPDLLRQLAAVLTTVEGASRLVLRHHLEACMVEAIAQGRAEEAVEELMGTLSYDRRLLRPLPGLEAAAGLED